MEITPQQFVAAQNRDQWNTVRPLDTQVNFVNDKRLALPEFNQVSTDWATLVFSTDGAVLDTVSFVRNGTDKSPAIQTVFGPRVEDQHGTFFLLAFDTATPYEYTLKNKTETDDLVVLTYQVACLQGTITKEFSVNKHVCRIDLAITIDTTAVSGGSVARLLFHSPIMPEITTADTVSAIVPSNTGAVVKIACPRLNKEQGWIQPALFGAENRYMVHALIADRENFAARAYYDVAITDRITAVLETVPLTAGSYYTWRMSFYCGPKATEWIIPVDSRLESTLEYSGIFAPLSRFFLMLLKWLYTYVHNYGYAIIILTILLKLLMLPLSWYNKKNEKRQREFKKKLAYIESRYKGDQATLQREREQLIRSHGMPGLGMGLLQMLVQIPPFFALSRLLSSSIELYKAPCMWIADLSASDPYYILPLIVFIAMVMHAFLMNSEQRMTFFVVCVVATGVAVNVSAGLALYIAVNSLMGAAQQYGETHLRNNA